jgi:hypothetical protein
VFFDIPAPEILRISGAIVLKIKLIEVKIIKF